MQLLIASPHLLTWEQSDMPATCLPRASNPPSNLGRWKTFILVSCLILVWMEKVSPVLYLHGEQAMA